jgi:sodium/potassium/calcium exchanger 6
MRDASIPTLQPEAWSKSYAVAHPIAAPLVLLVATGSWSAHVGSLSAPIFVCLVGLAPALAVYLLTLNSRPPKGGVVALLWVLGAFLMCVAWIYILAGELVVCLEALGRMLSVPSAYLGLTVLAWGNSIGDFFSNTSLARRGLGEMALAGCYGGPVFNMLVGLSLSIGYACLQTAPAPFVVQVDSSCIVSIVFLFIALGSTTAIVSMRGFRLERGTGYLLVTLYCLYSVVQALMALTNRE